MCRCVVMLTKGNDLTRARQTDDSAPKSWRRVWGSLLRGQSLLAIETLSCELSPTYNPECSIAQTGRSIGGNDALLALFLGVCKVARAAPGRCGTSLCSPCHITTVRGGEKFTGGGDWGLGIGLDPAKLCGAGSRPSKIGPTETATGHLVRSFVADPIYDSTEKTRFFKGSMGQWTACDTELARS